MGTTLIPHFCFIQDMFESKLELISNTNCSNIPFLFYTGLVRYQNRVDQQRVLQLNCISILNRAG